MSEWIKISAVVLAVLLQACTSSIPKAVVDYNPDYDFTMVKTYVLATDQSSVTDSLAADRIQKNISLQMQQHDIQPAAIADADVAVRFLLATEDKQKINTYNSGYYGGCYRCGGMGMGMGTTNVSVVEYKQGTLVIDMVDLKSKKTVWHVESQGRIDEKAAPQEREEKIRLIVENMLQQYPPVAAE